MDPETSRDISKSNLSNISNPMAVQVNLKSTKLKNSKEARSVTCIKNGKKKTNEQRDDEGIFPGEQASDDLKDEDWDRPADAFNNDAVLKALNIATNSLLAGKRDES